MEAVLTAASGGGTSLASTAVTAGFGLLGVVIGAGGNYLIQYLTARHTEGRERKSAIALVDDELSQALAILDGAIRATHMPTSLADELKTPTWEACRSVLAVGLTGQQWRPVSEAYARIGALRQDIVAGEAATGGRSSLVRGAVGCIRTALDTLRALDNA